MAVGDLINYTNYVALDGSSWRASTGLSATGSYTYIVSAPAWHFSYWIKGSGWWGYQEGSCSVYPYDEKTGTWGSAVYSGSGSVRGSGNSKTWSFSHNYNGGSSGDIHDCHIWKLAFYKGNNDGSKGGTLYVGGLGVVKETLYEPYFKGRYIYASKGDYWCIGSGYTYTTEDACLKAEGYSCMRGTQISVATGTYKYICAKPQ